MNLRYQSSPLRDSQTSQAGRSRLSRILLKLLATIALLWLSAGIAAPSGGWAGEAGQRETIIRSLPRGETFSNDGQPYVQLPTLRAGKEKGGDVRADQVRQGESAGSSGEVLAERGRFTIYRPAAATAAAVPPDAALAPTTPPSYPVVLNERTGALGVVTRRLWSKLKVMTDTDAIGREYGLEFSFANAAMRTSFYGVPGGVDIWALRTRLQSDPRVERVTLEIIDRVHRPQ